MQMQGMSQAPASCRTIDNRRLHLLGLRAAQRVVAARCATTPKLVGACTDGCICASQRSAGGEAAELKRREASLRLGNQVEECLGLGNQVEGSLRLRNQV